MDTLRAISWAGMKSVTSSSGNISRLAQGRKLAQRQRHYSTNWMQPEGQDGPKLSKQLTSRIPATKHSRLSTSSLDRKKVPADAIAAQLLKNSQYQGADKIFARRTLHFSLCRALISELRSVIGRLVGLSSCFQRTTAKDLALCLCHCPAETRQTCK